MIFKFYTTYLTKNELTSLSKINKPFSVGHSTKDRHPKTNIEKKEKTFIEDHSVFKAKKDLNEMMSYIIEKLKENKIIVTKNKDILTIKSKISPEKTRMKVIIFIYLNISLMQLKKIQLLIYLMFMHSRMNSNFVK